MITQSHLRWNVYHGWEGPVFPGNMPVPAANLDSSFHSKVLAITAAAEGGGFNAVQLWDSGLLSVGAIQFIDSGSWNVCNMLGEVAEACGVEQVIAMLKPALDICDASFSKLSDGKWRFSLKGQVVNTTALQKLLYFGDAQGNTKGSYNEAKRTRVKTWAVCMANVWDIPGSTDVQSDFTLRKLKDGFTWGSLRTDLFNGASEMDDGWLGATRAMLLAYAVNAPAIVVKRYDVARHNNKEKFSREWCLEVLHDVVINSGIDVWRNRWPAKLPFVEKAFGVKLPSYAQLATKTWSLEAPKPPRPEPKPATVEPEISVGPIVHPVPDTIMSTPPEDPPHFPVVAAASGWIAVFEVLFGFIKIMFEIMSKAFVKRQ